MLGIADDPQAPCTACDAQRSGCDCFRRSARNRQLVRLHKAVLPLRLDAWPYAGPVGVRERSDIHVIDRWRFLGTACNEGDVHELLRARRCAFDKRLYAMLRRTLRALPANAVLDLSSAAQNEPIRHAGEPTAEAFYPADGPDEFG